MRAGSQDDELRLLITLLQPFSTQRSIAAGKVQRTHPAPQVVPQSDWALQPPVLVVSILCQSCPTIASSSKLEREEPKEWCCC